MCMQDILIGRKVFFRETAVVVGTAKTRLVAADPRRVSLMVSAPATNPLWISANTSAAADVGIRIAAGGRDFRVDVKDQGQYVTAEFFANITAAGETITVVEGVLLE